MRTPIILPLCLTLATLAGCSSWFKAPSPIDGKPATAQQLAQQQRQLQAQQVAEQAKLQLQLEQAQRSSQDSRAAAKRSFQLASSRVQADAQTQLQALAAEFEQADAEATSALASVQASISSQLAAMQADTQRQAEGFAAALADIEEQRQAISGLLDVAQSAGQGFGPIGGVIGGLIGLGGVAIGIRGKRSADSIRAAATKVITAIDVARSKDPAFDAAITANADLLNEWQGDAGKALVDSVQKG